MAPPAALARLQGEVRGHQPTADSSCHQPSLISPPDRNFPAGGPQCSQGQGRTSHFNCTLQSTGSGTFLLCFQAVLPQSQTRLPPVCNLAPALPKPTEVFTGAAACCMKVSLQISDSSGSDKPGSGHSQSCSSTCDQMGRSIFSTSCPSVLVLPVPWLPPSLLPLKHHPHSRMPQRCWFPLPTFDLCPCLS